VLWTIWESSWETLSLDDTNKKREKREKNGKGYLKKKGEVQETKYYTCLHITQTNNLSYKLILVQWACGVTPTCLVMAKPKGLAH
jgi:hypothetical protein